MVKTNWIRSITSFFSLIALLTATSAVALAFSDKTSAMGEISVSGNSDGNGSYVMLNGQKAYNGRTFIGSGKIETKDQSATIKVKKLGLIKLEPNTTLNLSISEDNISGNLDNGKIKVFNKKGVDVSIDTPEGKISNSESQKSLFHVESAAGKTNLIAESGTLFLDEGESRKVVSAQDDDDDDNTSSFLWIAFAGVVAVAVLVVALNDDDVELQTISATF